MVYAFICSGTRTGVARIVVLGCTALVLYWVYLSGLSGDQVRVSNRTGTARTGYGIASSRCSKSDILHCASRKPGRVSSLCTSAGGSGSGGESSALLSNHGRKVRDGGV